PLNGESDGRVGHVLDEVDAVLIEPGARDVGADVGLVLVVGGQHLDRLAEDAAAEILHGHANGGDRSRSVDVDIGAGHIGQNTDPYRIVRDLCGGDADRWTRQADTAGGQYRGNGGC